MADKIIIDRIYKSFIDGAVICTDSRSVSSGCIFFALKGDNFNGNYFAAEAIKNGASLCVTDEKVEGLSKQNNILVDDVLICLQKLANHHRNKFDIPVLAITGSNGKTTTKELINVVLAQKYKTLYTKGNLNNHIGVPLTLLSLKKNDKIAIIEMGANHIGEIDLLCTITEPTHVLITNVGKAHLEGFGGFEGVKKGKGEMYDYAKATNATVFININDKELVSMLGTYENTVTFGSRNSLINGIAETKSDGLAIKLRIDGDEFMAYSKLTGSYNLSNILAAASLGKFFGVPIDLICNAIENYIPSNYRSQIIHHNGMTIVADTYNANPTSMDAAITSFTESYALPRLMFLGEMNELGEQSSEAHWKIAQQAVASEADVVFVGKSFQKYSGSCKWFADSTKAAEYASSADLEGKTILIKGSRGSEMEKVTQALTS
jgi:UDP-N-acetylmuramoyl-tripeptide--D-alanyl-D-alanine ligase